MGRTYTAFLVLISVCLLGLVVKPEPLRAEGAALVIGNGLYGKGLDVRQASNDAKLIADTLGKLEFTVRTETNVTRKQFLRAIRQFVESARKDSKIERLFFYYTGHAIQIEGKNYLIPAKAVITDEKSAKAKGIGLSAIVRGLRKLGAEQSVFVIDAARGFPLKKVTKPSPPGLAAFAAPFNSIVAFSARPGKVLFQEDQNKKHSAYALALAAQISVNGASLEEVFKSVRAQIAELTHPDHAPWENSSLVGDTVLAARPGDQGSKPDTKKMRESIAADAWRTLGGNPELTEVEAFLKFFPQASISLEAREKLADLRERQRKRQLANDKLVAKQASKTKRKAKPSGRVLSYFPKKPQSPILRDQTATKQLAAFINGIKTKKYRFSKKARGREVAKTLNFGPGFAGLFNEASREVLSRERSGEKITRKKLLALMRSIHSEQKKLERAARGAKGKFGLIVYTKSLQAGVSSYPLVWRPKPDFGVLYRQMERAYPELNGLEEEARFVKEADAIFWEMKSFHEKEKRIWISDVIKAMRLRALN